MACATARPGFPLRTSPASKKPPSASYGSTKKRPSPPRPPNGDKAARVNQTRPKRQARSRDQEVIIEGGGAGRNVWSRSVKMFPGSLDILQGGSGGNPEGIESLSPGLRAGRYPG